MQFETITSTADTSKTINFGVKMTKQYKKSLTMSPSPRLSLLRFWQPVALVTLTKENSGENLDPNQRKHRFSFLFVRRSREGKALEESDKVKIVSSVDGMYTLKLLNLTEEDSGQYTIKAVNDAGQTACTATLLVHGQSKPSRYM